MGLPPRSLIAFLFLACLIPTMSVLAKDESIEEIQELLLTHPDSAGIYVKLASLCFDEGSITGRRRAIEAMEQALRLEPRNANYHVILGQIFLASTFWHYGIEELEKALEIDPMNDGALYLSGKAYLDRALEGWQQKWFLKAESRLAHVPEESGFHHPACRYRAQALFDMGLIDSALAVMGSIEKDSLQTEDMLMLGMLSWKNNQLQTAWDWFAKALDKMDESQRERFLSIDLIAPEGELDAHQEVDLYWRMHDPDPATPVNERLVEHIARVAFADFHFSVPRLNKPGSETARGEVLIRYGLPLHWTYDPFGTGVVADESVMPQFSPLSGSSIDGILNNRNDFASRYRSRPLRISKPVWTWEYADFTLNFEDTFLNGDFGFPYERDWSAYVYAYLEKHIPEIYESQIRKRMNLVIDGLAVLDSTQHEAIKIIWGADTRGVTYEQKMRWPQTNFEIHLALLDSLYQDIRREEFERLVRADSSAIYLTDYPLIASHIISLPEAEYVGRYVAAVSIKSETNQAVGHASVEKKIRRMSDRFSLSDIELRFAEEGPPNPSHAFLQRSKVYIAFEIYNLCPDTTGTYGAEITLEISRKPQRSSFLRSLFGRLSRSSLAKAITAFSGSYQISSTSPRTQVTIGIDLSELLSGEYEVKVYAKDIASGMTAIANTSLIVASEMTP